MGGFPPVNLVGVELAGRDVVIAGGGAVATRRVRRLSTARITVVAPEVSDDIRRRASHGDLTWIPREIAAEDLDGAWFVVAATDNPGVNDAVAQWAQERRIWCVHAGSAAKGTARMAATSTHGDVSIGVVSRDAPDPERIRAIRDAVAAHIDAGAVDMRRHRNGGGRVILVGSGPGDPGLITVRGRQALAEADVVVTDRLGATSLLSQLPYDVEVINVGKSPDNHPVPQADINALIVSNALAGRTVVRLKGGDPFVFGRGGEEVQACVAAGIDVEIVPGVTSAIAVPGLAGIPVTHRSVTTSVVISSGHAGADGPAIAAMASGATAIFLMAVTALPQIVDAALAAGASPETPVAIIENGSTPSQRITRGNLETIVRISGETGVKPPAVIVVGQVAREGFLDDSAG
jgi:uroporphyrin-III C-methyltransferase/precorrin-2 dehydrogenase/sirohydrochlorin ferrochelatase